MCNQQVSTLRTVRYMIAFELLNIILSYNACDLTCGAGQFADTLLAHGGTALGRVIEVCADLGLMCFHVDVDARVVCPLDKQELTHGGVVLLAL